MATSGERGGGGAIIGVVDQEVQTAMYKISYKNILYSTGKYSHYFIIILNGV